MNFGAGGYVSEGDDGRSEVCHISKGVERILGEGDIGEALMNSHLTLLPVTAPHAFRRYGRSTYAIVYIDHRQSGRAAL